MPCPRNLRNGRKDAGRSDTRSVCGDHHDRRRRKMPDIASSSAPPTTDANGAAIERPNNHLAIIPPLPDRRTARTPRPLAIPRQSASDAEWLNLCRVSSCHCPVAKRALPRATSASPCVPCSASATTCARSSASASASCATLDSVALWWVPCFLFSVLSVRCEASPVSYLQRL